MAKFPSDEYGKTAVWRLRGNSIYILPRSNVFVYILQSFPDVLGDQRGRRDTSISLEVCKCLQYIPVVVLTQQPRTEARRKRTELEASATLLITAHWPLLRTNSNPAPWSAQPQRALRAEAACWQDSRKPAIPRSQSLGPSPERLCESQRLGERTLKKRRKEAKRGDHTERDRAEGKMEG